MVIMVIILVGMIAWVRWSYHHPTEQPAAREGTLFTRYDTNEEKAGITMAVGILLLVLTTFSRFVLAIVSAVVLLCIAVGWWWAKGREPVRMDYDRNGLTFTRRNGKKVYVPGEQVRHLCFEYDGPVHLLGLFHIDWTIYSNTFPRKTVGEHITLCFHTAQGERFKLFVRPEDAKQFMDFWNRRPYHWGTAPTHLKGAKRIAGGTPCLLWAGMAGFILLMLVVIWFGMEEVTSEFRRDMERLESTRITLSELVEKKSLVDVRYDLIDDTGQEYPIEGKQVWCFAAEDFKKDFSEGDYVWITYARRTETHGWSDMLFGLLDEEGHLCFRPHTDSSVVLYGISTGEWVYMERSEVLEALTETTEADWIAIGLALAVALGLLLCIPYFHLAARRPERHPILLRVQFKQGRVLRESGVPMALD